MKKIEKRNNSMANETEITLQFIVEDGTCVSNANSYISLEDANQYMTNKGREDWLALSDEQKKISIIKGTEYVDNLYRWRGQRLGIAQNLSWPRVDRRHQDWLLDLDGFPLKGVPRRLKDAVCEAAFYGYQANVELFTTYNETGNVKKQRVEGAVEVEFFSAKDSTADYISKYASLDALLRGLYLPKNKSDVNAIGAWDY